MRTRTFIGPPLSPPPVPSSRWTPCAASTRRTRSTLKFFDGHAVMANVGRAARCHCAHRQVLGAGTDPQLGGRVPLPALNGQTEQPLVELDRTFRVGDADRHVIETADLERPGAPLRGQHLQGRGDRRQRQQEAAPCDSRVQTVQQSLAVRAHTLWLLGLKRSVATSYSCRSRAGINGAVQVPGWSAACKPSGVPRPNPTTDRSSSGKTSPHNAA